LIFILHNFEFAVSHVKYAFPFPLVTAKLVDDYFDNRQYGANKACLKCQSILLTESSERKQRCAPNQKKIREFKTFS
jgi:hypothetical protein